ncbi:uncharacterized protein EV420DRAFT_415823 [Desarmillaria tabescens]|uniref:Heterokaryon incompatibility domain-containing protein n=1 Tax=Armillaria tabescens TaxID=1929756 RepID=A0AA39KG20_ARMTA|nr:uncharacterized protein EV420DRAFT_415823 [Desarmillaria tabescens]KAK0458113.1 hypothetical protein EV420DRAFT_415823 [Desarmillaria tabescens]
MGITRYKALYQWILGGVMSIWNHIRSRSVFLTARTSTDDTSERDENHNTSESQKRQFYARGCWSRLVARLRPSIMDARTFLESDDDGLRPPRDLSLPEVTISAFTEMGQAESSIIVPLQRSYTGRKPVIPSRLANTPCTTLGLQGLLDQLNTTLGTSHTLHTPSFSSLLSDCLTNNYDFGTAYSRLRPIWYTRDWSTIRSLLRRKEEEDQEIRRKALAGNRIVNPWLPPRRVWDLYSNRVVPWWITDVDGKLRWPQPISHAWVDEKDRADVWTPINGYEWPVPIPKDSDLNFIRIEMLNLGLEYAWLDVLCLRQVGGPGEDVRAEEWKLDVPMIGAVYRATRVVLYLNGLGRSLTLKEGDLDSDRSWFRRAWTLQEVGWRRVFAGDTLDGPLQAKPIDENGNYQTELLTKFHKHLQSVHNIPRQGVFAVLESMQNRVSTNPVDKVAGLACFLGSKTIPAYYESQSLEEAWTALVNSMDKGLRGVLFAWFAGPGDAGTKWRPSWNQVMRVPLDGGYTFGVNVDLEGDENWCTVDCIEGRLDGRGELVVRDGDGVERGFKIVVPIPEGMYTLICPDSGNCLVVGRTLSGKRFEKVSVVKLTEEESGRLWDLNITEKRRYILV